MENYQMIAKTLAGLENVLIKELEELGAEKVQKRKRAVLFEGNDELMMKANISLRTAISILIPLIEFEAADEYALYDNVFAIQWEEIFGLEDTFSISATVSGELFTHSQYVALKSKDAIAESEDLSESTTDTSIDEPDSSSDESSSLEQSVDAENSNLEAAESDDTQDIKVDDSQSVK